MKLKYFFITAILLLSFFYSNIVEAVDNSALIAQLQAQIAQLMLQIQTLQAQQDTNLDWCHNFNNNLGFAQSNTSEISHLHTALDKQGFSYAPDTTNQYYMGTVSAVKKFQAKYGISQLGYVGPSTRAKLNQLYKCATVVPPVTPPVATCTPNWQTGTWSVCSNGTQSRSVADANGCGVLTNKPSTSQPCTSQINCVPDCPASMTCRNGECINICPQYAPPAPGFCAGGTITYPSQDINGCVGHPVCTMPTCVAPEIFQCTHGSSEQAASGIDTSNLPLACGCQPPCLNGWIKVTVDGPFVDGSYRANFKCNTTSPPV